MIAATRSGSGKTVLTLGLMRALARRGLRVAGRKNGPDYIDPAFHAAVTGRPSYNLDSWSMPPDLLRRLAAADDADLVVCEGSMGLFDGVPADDGSGGSSADVAALAGWPVVMVHDCSGQSQSAAALLAGCAAYDPRIRVAGVILNRIASERHRRLVADAVARVGLPVLGSVPRTERLALPERHLGLVQAGETGDLEPRVEAAADVVAEHVDLDALMAVAGLPADVAAGGPPAGGDAGVPLRPPGQRIAVARDAAFSFLYPHVLDGWRAAGAELAFFSPLADEAPPAGCDACWLPGGYPELQAGRIAAAARFLAGLRAFAGAHPVHGECGGYMVLGQGLVDGEGARHAMAGLLGVETSFARRKLNLGYRDATTLVSSGLGPAGTRLRGHEFHYATVLDRGGDDPLAMATDAYGAVPAPAGSRRANVTGTFFHALAERHGSLKLPSCLRPC
ncbi:cobyrinate a,c-diamide synthase [Lichenibacterium ramalinae]|uniref:Hydrogenobyrinate a,c-diamide synthase n=1 Tax=Lichenibacterium ramalinae TaxID=2316527 RepID=A0A4Q2R9R6_9HYPH|nr:cobyrinate a,c-diamide synthase [Lichenibacterium ramalinae]RYB03644.1 cobyrinate a,c-diamide synthase [Lichenibacterium ramalinae]